MSLASRPAPTPRDNDVCQDEMIEDLFSVENFSEVDTCVEIMGGSGRHGSHSVASRPRSQKSSASQSQKSRKARSRSGSKADHGTLGDQSLTTAPGARMQPIDEDIHNMVKEDVRRMIAKIRSAKNQPSKKQQEEEEEEEEAASTDKKLVNPGKYGEVDPRARIARARKQQIDGTKKEKTRKKNSHKYREETRSISITQDRNSTADTDRREGVREKNPAEETRETKRPVDPPNIGYYKNKSGADPEHIVSAQGVKGKGRSLPKLEPRFRSDGSVASRRSAQSASISVASRGPSRQLDAASLKKIEISSDASSFSSKGFQRKRVAGSASDGFKSKNQLPNRTTAKSKQPLGRHQTEVSASQSQQSLSGNASVVSTASKSKQPFSENASVASVPKGQQPPSGNASVVSATRKERSMSRSSSVVSAASQHNESQCGETSVVSTASKSQQRLAVNSVLPPPPPPPPPPRSPSKQSKGRSDRVVEQIVPETVLSASQSASYVEPKSQAKKSEEGDAPMSMPHCGPQSSYESYSEQTDTTHTDLPETEPAPTADAVEMVEKTVDKVEELHIGENLAPSGDSKTPSLEKSAITEKTLSVDDLGLSISEWRELQHPVHSTPHFKKTVDEAEEIECILACLGEIEGKGNVDKLEPGHAGSPKPDPDPCRKLDPIPSLNFDSGIAKASLDNQYSKRGTEAVSEVEAREEPPEQKQVGGAVPTNEKTKLREPDEQDKHGDCSHQTEKANAENVEMKDDYDSSGLNADEPITIMSLTKIDPLSKQSPQQKEDQSRMSLRAIETQSSKNTTSSLIAAMQRDIGSVSSASVSGSVSASSAVSVSETSCPDGATQEATDARAVQRPTSKPRPAETKLAGTAPADPTEGTLPKERRRVREAPSDEAKDSPGEEIKGGGEGTNGKHTVEPVAGNVSTQLKQLEYENARLKDTLNFLQQTAVEKEKYFAELAWFGKRSEEEVQKWRPNFWRERLADLGPVQFEEFRADAMRIADPDVGDWEHGFSSGSLAMARLLLGLSHAVDDEKICAFHDPGQSCTRHCVTCSVDEQRKRELADFPVLDP